MRREILCNNANGQLRTLMQRETHTVTVFISGALSRDRLSSEKPHGCVGHVLVQLPFREVQALNKYAPGGSTLEMGERVKAALPQVYIKCRYCSETPKSKEQQVPRPPAYVSGVVLWRYNWRRQGYIGVAGSPN